jgi:hypothetical protein
MSNTVCRRLNRIFNFIVNQSSPTAWQGEIVPTSSGRYNLVMHNLDTGESATRFSNWTCGQLEELFEEWYNVGHLRSRQG